PKESKTRSSRRTVKVNAETAAAINAHIALNDSEKRHTSPLLFPTLEGGYYWPANVSGFFLKRLLRRAGLSPTIRFHDLRHTCAPLLSLAGVDVKTVAARLGHSTPVTTHKTYPHLLPEGEDRAVNAIGRYLRPAT